MLDNVFDSIKEFVTVTNKGLDVKMHLDLMTMCFYSVGPVRVFRFTDKKTNFKT